MHYECELAVVIGKPARSVVRARRDGARRRLHDRQRLRDPRLPRELVPAEPARQEPRRRDRARPLAGRCGRGARRRPHCALRTLVNGRQTQSGNTRDLVFDIAVPDRIPERVHDAGAGRRDPDRHARRRRQRRCRRRGRRARSTASAGWSTRSSATQRSVARAVQRDRPERNPSCRVDHLIDGQAGREPRATSRPSTRRRRTCWPRSRAAAPPRSTPPSPPPRLRFRLGRARPRPSARA